MSKDLRAVRRALISVSDKDGIVQFAMQLSSLGIEIVSTGGTSQLLTDAGIPVVEVSELTQYPEMMDGRVKTLHPRIHGGLLGRRGIDDEIMVSHQILPIDLLIVNLYPFEKTVSKSAVSINEAIENIDIGGPAMIRAAAKNYNDVTVLVDQNDYDMLLKELSENDGGIPLAFRFKMAAKAFVRTAAYDAAIGNYLTSITDGGEKEYFPETYTAQWVKIEDLRYGENSHQRAAFYRDPESDKTGIASSVQLQGKSLSYNNLADSDAAWECVKQFENPACVIVKHANPCGVSEGSTVLDAYAQAYETDPTSAFGGIIAFNRPVDQETMAAILDRQFVEVIVAPEFDSETLVVASRKKNVRILKTEIPDSHPTLRWECKPINGGVLVQDCDQSLLGSQDYRVVTHIHPSPSQLVDLLFAWKVAKFVKSNAIVYAKNSQTIGIGAGQMSRVYSARIAAIKAHDVNLQIGGSVMASDAFFPFRDGVDAAAQEGVSAIIQPGGSLRDEEVIAAADEHGLAMVFTGIRHFRH